MTTIKRILVATNFDAPSRHAIDAALSMAERLGATLTLVHVLDLPLYAYYAERLPSNFASSLESVAVSQLADTLARIRTRVPSANALLCHGVPWRQIAANAENMGCQLVVVGTHARSRTGQSLLGSVARDVSRACLVPVLTIQDPNAANRPLPAYS